MIQIKAGEVVLDYTLYPRHQVDAQHVGEIREAIRAGVAMPPIKTDRKSKRAVDGFHRSIAFLKEHGPGHPIDAIDHPYRSEKAMFLDAMRLNANHGRNLTSFDRAHCILLAKGFGLADKDTAAALSITVNRVESLIGNKTAVKGNGKSTRKQPETMAIKRTIGHKAGQALTKAQQDANEKLGGMNQLFYVNQLVMLFETDLVDREKEDLVKRLEQLGELIANM